MPEINYIVKNLREACQNAKSEDDIKAASNIFFNNIAAEFGIEIDAHSEVTSAHGGRADSIYNDIVCEFKDKGILSKKKGVKEVVYGRDEKDHGLYHYLINFSLQEATESKDAFIQVIQNKIGVGFDGEYFIFARFRKSNTLTSLDLSKTNNWPKGWSNSVPIEFEVIDKLQFDDGVKRLLLYVRSTKRLALTAEKLCTSFSNQSTVTKTTVEYLYKLLEKSICNNTRIKTLYEEWERIFGTIYDEEENSQTDFVKINYGIAKMYGIGSSGTVDVKKALFAIQTYYSIMIKLLVQNLYDSLVSPGNKMSEVSDVSDLMWLFTGKRNNFENKIDNFFEISFFEWFTLTPDLNIEYINNIIRELDKFETTASVIKPEVVQDVLKKTYESITPKELRHLMGEYYTVNWLADFTIKKSGYDCGMHTSVIDPTCGSGTFIMHLIKNYINKYGSKLNYENLVENIVDNFVGFDINPIAVIQSKGNYILSLGDITSLEKQITIPIYMCDSILVPTVYAKQKKGDKTLKISTSRAEFDLPVFENRHTSDIFSKTLSECILTDYTAYEEFSNRLKTEYNIDIPEEAQNVARVLFNTLRTLHNNGQDGFWPIILKNSYAPMFCRQKFDYVIGNPPWIAWKAMSESYRKLTLDIWLSYGIFEKNSYDKITTHDDFAMAVTYVAIDHYLKNNGIAAFILPQTFVKSAKGGEGFRKFCITRDGQQEPFSVEAVYDMLKINPFKGIANNKTSVYIFKKSKKMTYPMNSYFECHTKNNAAIHASDSYAEVSSVLEMTQKSAKPINSDPRSPWMTIEASLIGDIDKYRGKSCYEGRKGIEPCGAKGIYLIDIKSRKKNLLEIENLVERSRLEKIKNSSPFKDFVEDKYVYPMVGGRNIDKWGLNSYIYMLVPHNEGDGAYRGVPTKDMKSHFPKTYKWLYHFHDILLETRIRSAKFYDPKQFPWYRLDNIGPYTFKPYKVLWKEQSQKMNCCVVSKLSDRFVSDKNVVMDSKVLYVALDDEMEAYYLCGLMNSNIIETIVQSYTISTNRGIDIVKNIAFPKYDKKNKLHVKLAKASKKAHEDYINRNQIDISKQEAQINKLTPQIFNSAKINP